MRAQLTKLNQIFDKIMVKTNILNMREETQSITEMI